MDKNSNQTNIREPTLCRKCETFYGNPQHNNMCSKCFKEQSAGLEEPVAQKLTEKIAEPALDDQTLQTQRPPQTDKSKCWCCTKKTGLLAYDCKCGYSFCKTHRLPETHECLFDFVAHGKKILTLNNPVVKNDKLERM